MKKFLAIMLSVLLVSALLISCGKKEEPAPAATTTPAPAATTAPDPAAPAPKAEAEPAAPAPAAVAEPAAPAKDEIVFRISNGAEPESLDPALIQGVPEHRIFEALFEGLVAIDPETA
ncbi:MAG: peptide ABC transporter substrate-binding protein, partial [Sphaerochaeta sp.]